MRANESINPCLLSVEEAAFLIDHVGDPPEVVEIDVADSGYGVGVNPAAVLPLIERVYRLKEQEEHRGVKWIGVAAVKDGLAVYVREMKRWAADAKRGGPKLPSLYVWDEQGRGHKGAVGADAVVTTYFDDNGDRKPFAFDLIPGDQTNYLPTWIRPRQKAPVPKLLRDGEKAIITCPVCFFTQNYDKDSRTSHNLAESRMRKHLIHSRKDADKHREVYTQEFGSPAILDVKAR